MAFHHEVHHETYVVKKLIENGSNSHYDPVRALYPEEQRSGYARRTPQIARTATVETMKSHNHLARLLSKDPQNMAQFFSLVYDITKHGEARNLIE